MTPPKSALDGLPMLAKVAAIVGVPSAIALYLVYIVASGIASAAELKALDLKIETHMERTEVLSTDRTKQLEVQTRLLRLMCQSVAKTEAVRVECNR